MTVKAKLTGLRPDKTYYYRVLLATSTDGSDTGALQSFKTTAKPVTRAQALKPRSLKTSGTITYKEGLAPGDDDVRGAALREASAHSLHALPAGAEFQAQGRRRPQPRTPQRPWAGARRLQAGGDAARRQAEGQDGCRDVHGPHLTAQHRSFDARKDGARVAAIARSPVG